MGNTNEINTNESAAITKKAKELFISYPSAKEFHFTSDNLAFAQKCDADNHARTLEDKKVVTVKKEK